MPQRNEASPTPPDSAAAFPRLSIGYLLLLTLMIAFALAWGSPYIRPLLSYPAEQFPGGKWIYIATRLAESTIIGLKLFGLVVIVQQWWRGARWRLEPGHWYFVATAIVVVDYLLNVTVLVIQPRGRSASLQNALAGIDTLTYFIVGSMCVLAAVAVKPWRWRSCMGLLAASNYVVVLACAINLVEKFGLSVPYSYKYDLPVVYANLDFAFGLATCAAVAIDLHQGVRRDWLHYLAVATIVLSTATLFDTTSSPLVEWWTNLVRRVIG